MRVLIILFLLVGNLQAETASGKWIWVKVTGYTPWDKLDSKSRYQDGYTSIMVNTRSTNPNKIYGIATNPRHIGYHTKIYVPGYWESLRRNKVSRPTKMVKVDDTGSIVRKFKPHWRRIDGQLRFVQAHLDVRYRTRRGINRFLPRGKKYMKVFVFD